LHYALSIFLSLSTAQEPSSSLIPLISHVRGVGLMPPPLPTHTHTHTHTHTYTHTLRNARTHTHTVSLHLYKTLRAVFFPPLPLMVQSPEWSSLLTLILHQEEEHRASGPPWRWTPFFPSSPAGRELVNYDYHLFHLPLLASV